MRPTTFKKDERTQVLAHLAPRDASAWLNAITEGCARQGLRPTLINHPTGGIELGAVRWGRVALYIGVVGREADAETWADAQSVYDRAIQENIPCLMFLQAGASSPWAARLSQLPTTTRFVNTAELRGALVNRLAPYHQADFASFHYVGNIPKPPAVYTAHPYTLLPTTKMIGRQKELDTLTEWITATDHQVRVLNVIAIGGMGKSAMTWKWYQDIAPEVMKPMAGRMWWSFYESDAYYENFIIRTLAYVSGREEEEVREITPPEREQELLDILDREPFLICMDGIERFMIAYARMDAARLEDDDLDIQTQNTVAGAIGVPKTAEQTIFTPHRLRKTADPRAGAFLRKLASVRSARILISSRLYPSDLQRLSGYPIPGSFAMFLTGLDDAGAMELWRAFGLGGTPEEMLPIFHTFENYPLLIRVLAGEVSSFADGKGDFAAWRRAHPGFDPTKVPPAEVKAHVMAYALGGLTEGQRKTLDTIAAFRMPSYYDALARLLVKGKAPEVEAAEQPKGLGGMIDRITRSVIGSADNRFTRFEDEAGLDAALEVLETRGLMGWDRVSNRYDLHPIVRAVSWNALDEPARRGLYAKLNAHFSSLPAVGPEDVRSMDDLTGSIEMYNTLIGLGRFDEAFGLYINRLHMPMMRRLSANLQRVELLEPLFPFGFEAPPKLSTPEAQARAYNLLALAYHASGQPGKAAQMYVRAAKLAEQENAPRNVSIALNNLADTMRLSGQLRVAEMVANRALMIAQVQEDREGEAFSLLMVALGRMSVGSYADSLRALQRAIRLLQAQNIRQLLGVAQAQLAQHYLYTGDYAAALQAANQAWELADHAKYEADYVRAARMQGGALLGLGDYAAAENRLALALTRARAVNLVEQELNTLIHLADLRRLQGQFTQARTLMEDAWEPADRGPFRLLHADGYRVMTRLELDQHNADGAAQTAKALYYLAWCDGEPYAYAAGLAEAKAAYERLGLPAPDDLPPFDEASYGPYLPVEIDPQDEFAARGSNGSH